MKYTHFLLLITCTILQSCFFLKNDDDEVIAFSSVYEPVNLSRTELDNAIQLKPAKTIVNSGKIYVANDLLLVGEKREGFHIFDNSDPQNPTKLRFLEVLGATDVAIRDRTLYLNQATDLVAIQFDLIEETVQVTKRVANTFPE